jgi:hypothetical protein
VRARDGIARLYEWLAAHRRPAAARLQAVDAH